MCACYFRVLIVRSLYFIFVFSLSLSRCSLFITHLFWSLLLLRCGRIIIIIIPECTTIDTLMISVSRNRKKIIERCWGDEMKLHVANEQKPTIHISLKQRPSLSSGVHCTSYVCVQVHCELSIKRQKFCLHTETAIEQQEPHTIHTIRWIGQRQLGAQQ